MPYLSNFLPYLLPRLFNPIFDFARFSQNQESKEPKRTSSLPPTIRPACNGGTTIVFSQRALLLHVAPEEVPRFFLEAL